MHAPAHRERDHLRFLACGAVDDGKSTLIGRLMAETGSIPDDQMANLVNLTKKFGTTGDNLDYALLLDGLEAEREQGITIDVAYRYFGTPKRAFIVADTPGHEQYTRNMVTGASNAEFAMLLVDAKAGLTKQTLRHSRILSLLGIRRILLAVNKMDLVDCAEAPFAAITEEVPQIRLAAFLRPHRSNSDCRPRWRQHRASQQAHALVQGPDGACASGNRPGLNASA